MMQVRVTCRKCGVKRDIRLASFQLTGCGCGYVYTVKDIDAKKANRELDALPELTLEAFRFAKHILANTKPWGPGMGSDFSRIPQDKTNIDWANKIMDITLAKVGCE